LFIGIAIKLKKQCEGRLGLHTPLFQADHFLAERFAIFAKQTIFNCHMPTSILRYRSDRLTEDFNRPFPTAKIYLYSLYPISRSTYEIKFIVMAKMLAYKPLKCSEIMYLASNVQITSRNMDGDGQRTDKYWCVRL